MKTQFNLRKALDGAKVVTRDDREVEVKFYDPRLSNGLVVMIKDPTGWILWNLPENGINPSLSGHNDFECPEYDLFIVD